MRNRMLSVVIIVFIVLSACRFLAPIPPKPGATPVPGAQPVNETQPPSASPTENPPVSEAAGPAYSNATLTELVDMIVAGPDLPTAVLAVQAALARGGVATTDLTNVLVPAQSPAASAQVLPEETLNLALEAYQLAGSTMTLADLGKMLQDFGWKFQASPAPGEQLGLLIKEWLAVAQKDPADPAQFWRTVHG